MPPRAIAVWNTAFLGDAVLTLPLIRALKTAFPDAAIDFYVRNGLGALFREQPELRAVHDIRKARSARALWQLERAVRARRYDLWISPHRSLRSTLLAAFCGAPVKVGYAGFWRDLVYTRTVPRRFGELDEIERLLGLLSPVLAIWPDARRAELTAASLADPAAPLHWPRLVPPARARDSVEALLAAMPGPRLAIHPGSVWETKRWTPAGFAHVARRAVEAGAQVLLLGTPAERPGVDAVLEAGGLRHSPAVHDLTGRLSLPELAACLARVDALVCNDSGPLHLAWAAHTPVTALFGPTIRGFGFAPRGERATLVEVDLPCRPCGRHGGRVCPQGHHRCMRDIDPEAVWQQVRPNLFPPEAR